MIIIMKLRALTLILPLIPMVSFFAESKKSSNADDFRLRPSVGGNQTGWLDAKGLPTAIHMNGRWVLPRGGTMEWLMKKGYVTDPENSSVMKPNPHDKRYKKPRPIVIMPSLTTMPNDYIYPGISPRFKNSNDPFEGLADPMKRKYSPIPGAGATPGVQGDKTQLGPVLDPDPQLPTLKNSPFAPNPNPFQPAGQEKVAKPGTKPPSQDPFADQLDNPLNPEPSPDPNVRVLPGNPVENALQKGNPFLPERPDA